MSALINLTLGVTYKFKFESRFAQFDGVYTVNKVMTYEEYLNDERNLVDDWYGPAELTEADLTADLEQIQETKILKLHVPDTDISEDIFAPLCFVENVPDCNVKKYYVIGMVSEIGLTERPEDLESMRDAFIELTEATLGITPDPIFTTVGEGKWLTESEYQEELAKRDAEKMKMMNYFIKSRQLDEQLSTFKTMIQEYEATIIKLNEENTRLKEQLGE